MVERESLGLTVSHFLHGDDRLARLRWTEAKSLERAPYVLENLRYRGSIAVLAFLSRPCGVLSLAKVALTRHVLSPVDLLRPELIMRSAADSQTGRVAGTSQRCASAR